MTQKDKTISDHSKKQKILECFKEIGTSYIDKSDHEVLMHALTSNEQLDSNKIDKLIVVAQNAQNNKLVDLVFEYVQDPEVQDSFNDVVERYLRMTLLHRQNAPTSIFNQIVRKAKKYKCFKAASTFLENTNDFRDVKLDLIRRPFFELILNESVDTSTEIITNATTQVIEHGVVEPETIEFIAQKIHKQISGAQAESIAQMAMTVQRYDYGNKLAKFDIFMPQLRNEVVSAVGRTGIAHDEYDDIINTLIGYDVFENSQSKNSQLISASTLIDATAKVINRSDKKLLRWFVDTFGTEIYKNKNEKLYDDIKDAAVRGRNFPAMGIRFLLDHDIVPNTENWPYVERGLRRAEVWTDKDQVKKAATQV